MRLLGQVIDGKAYGRCYMISNLNAMSLLTGKEISDTMFRKFLKDMEDQGHNPKHGKMFTSGPNSTPPRWKENMGDTITVSEIKIFSPIFRVNIFKKIPMVVSINVGDQFRKDREDGVLDDTILDDTVKNGHAIVIQGLRMYDSRRDQKNYSITRTYLTNVKGLFKSTTALVFKKS